MDRQSDSLRKNIAQLLENDQHILQHFYIKMYKEYSQEIRNRLDVIERSDSLFQEAFVIWTRKLAAQKEVLFTQQDRDLETSIFALFRKIIHDKMLHIDISVSYIIEQIRKNDKKAKERLSDALCNDQNLSYAQYLVQSLKISSLEGKDFLQESFLAMLTTIEKGRFNLDATLPNDTQIRKLFKYFREIIYRQIHKSYHKNKPTSELRTDLEEPPSIENIHSGVEKSELAIYQSFYTLDLTSQKIMQFLVVDKLSPKEVVRKLNHPSFTETKDIVNHKKKCLSTLRKLTAEKISEMDSKSFNRYLEVCRNALRSLTEPCKTILLHFLPPLQKSYREILEIIKTSSISERNFLRTEDQVKRRKYKCMQSLHDQIWQKLFTEIH